MTTKIVYLAVSFVLALSAACGSSSGDGGGAVGKDGGSSGDAGGADGARSCECRVEVDGQAEIIACGSQACVGKTVFACDGVAKITKGGVCANDAGSDGAAIADSGTADSNTPPACYEPSCTNDSECRVLSSTWKCYALDATNGASACLPDQLIFGGDQPGDPCVNYPNRIARHVTCTDGKIAVCVPKTCTATGEQPASLQPRRCY